MAENEQTEYQKGYRAAHTDLNDEALGREAVIEAAMYSKKLSQFAFGYRTYVKIHILGAS